MCIRDSSYGYVIATGSMEKGLKLSITYGAVQRRMLEAGEMMELESVDEEEGIYLSLIHI